MLTALDKRTPLGTALEAAKSVPVNVEELARRLGVDVRKAVLPDHISGKIEKKDDGAFAVTINAAHPKTRQRFTLAHELGHFIFHRHRLGEGTNDTKKYRADPETNAYSNGIERHHETEANQFAASILMPEDLVVKFYDRFRPNDLDRMADFFGVSTSAMEIRIESLRKRGRL